MNIPLRSFEEYVDEASLEKGLQIWEKGRVTPPVLVEAGVYESEVGTGKDRQTVRLTVDNGRLIACECTAGDAGDTVCPHVAAALFGMELGIENAPAPAAEASPAKRGREKAAETVSGKKKPAKAGKKPAKKKEEEPLLPPMPAEEVEVSPRLQRALEEAAREHLIRFLKEESKRTKDLEDRFIAWLDRATGKVSSAAFALYFNGLVDEIWSKARGQIDGKAMTQLLSPMREQLKRSRKILASGNYREPLAVAQAIIQVTDQLIKRTTSQHRRPEMLQEDVYSILEEISRMELTEDVQDEIIHFILKVFEGAGISSGQWKWDGLDLAASLADTEKQKSYVLQSVEKRLGKGKTSDPSEIALREKLALKILSLLKQWRPEQEAVSFMKEKIYLLPVADALMEHYLNSGQAEKAKQLANEQIPKTRIYKQEAHWYDWLMRIALGENDKEAIVHNALWRLRRDPKDALNYYRIIADNSPARQRRENVKTVLATLDTYMGTRPVMLSIYAEEGMWKELRQTITRYMEIDWLVKNTDFILEKKPDLLPELTRELIPRLITVFHYDFPRGAAALIANLRKSGFEREADVLQDEINDTLTRKKGFHLLDAFELVLRKLLG